MGAINPIDLFRNRWDLQPVASKPPAVSKWNKQAYIIFKNNKFHMFLYGTY